MLSRLIQDTFSVPEDIGLDVLRGTEIGPELYTVIVGIDTIFRQNLKFMNSDEPVELLADPVTIEVYRLYTGPHIIEGLDDIVPDTDACNFHNSCVLIRWY